jgi:hypothetical protein
MVEEWIKIERAFFTPQLIEEWRKLVSMFEGAEVISMDAKNKNDLKAWLDSMIDTNGGDSLYIVRCKVGYVCVTSNSPAGKTVACFIRDALQDAVRSRAEISQLRAALAIAKHLN